MPAIVEKTTGKKADIIPKSIIVKLPKPNQIINNGASAIPGMGIRTIISGVKKELTCLNKPIKTPTTTPNKTPKMVPRKRRCSVVLTWFNRVE
jgi:hypothetical protein